MTHQERAFADVFARTNDIRYSAERAGYASPASGHKAAHRPNVKARVAAVRERFAERAVEVAFTTLIEIAEDQTAGKMPRVSASDKLLKGAGVYEGQSEETDDKDLHDMSASALYRLMAAAGLGANEVIDVEVEPPKQSLRDPLFD